MFKRLADRVSSAVASVTASASASASNPSSASTSSSHSSIDTLKSMGFSEIEARHALQINGDHVEQAAEWLLTNGTPTMHSAVATQTEQDDMQRALEASLAENKQPPQAQSAAARKAGQAALTRFQENPACATRTKIKIKPKQKQTPKQKPSTATVAATKPTVEQNGIASHPNVHVPKRLSQHDKEDQIMRCANRIAPHPLAVDTLLKSLKQLQQHPNNQKFQIIDTSSAAFQKNLGAPGVLDYFKAMNYHPGYADPRVLKLAFVDAATLYLGISALEQVQQTSQEYKNNKSKLLFDKEILKILQLADSDMQEALKSSEFMSKCPSEPTRGGGLITVELGAATKISRKFDGDDTLGDVLNWLGGHGSELPQKLIDGHWHFVNRNHANAPPYNISELQPKTLQYIGCWPSARLAVVPIVAPTQNERIPSSSRGLGAAPMDHLR